MTLQQTDIFSMFGIEDEVSEQKKREEEERQKRLEEAKKRAEEAKKAESNTSTKSAIKKEEDVFDVTMDTVIRYLGEDIPVTEYFTPEELTQGLPSKKKNEEEVTFKKIDGNEVRKRMEKDYPELIAQYTEMVYIKKKNIILPVQKAKKKGNNCMKEESLSGDSSFMPKRIPFTLLQEFIALSKYFSEEYGTEVHGDIYLNLAMNEFFLDIPEQVVSPVFTEVTEDAIVTAEKLINIPHKKVMEIHSHHVMSATPSRIDNANERREGIFYAIVGRIDRFFPELTVRVFSHDLQKHVELDPGLVFEHPSSLSLLTQYDLSNVQVVK